MLLLPYNTGLCFFYFQVEAAIPSSQIVDDSYKVCLSHSEEKIMEVYVVIFFLLCGTFAPYLGT